ncbi:MAG TPA: carboxymuconolactone decarboxylase family protein [Thermomicrobiales bacterium]
MTTERYSMKRVAPDAYRAMSGLQQVLATSSLPHSLLELVKMRASQINRCAFCLDMHSKDALALGVPLEKLFLLDAWHEATCFTEQERAALAWTEELTLIAATGVSDDTYTAARARFSERELAELTLAIVAINGWNRIAVSTRMEPGHYTSRLQPEADGATA